MKSGFVPFHVPSLGPDEEEAVIAVLRSGWLTAGPQVERFEEAFALSVGAEFAVATSSCTAAMHLALATFGIGPGDEVIVPTMTFAATANVVVHLGAKPVLVDVEQDTLTLDPAWAARTIQPRTKAIMPVDFGGHPADLATLSCLAESNGLALVEDAAHSLGGECGGRRIGSIADATCFSFYATKNITTGDGGMVTTDSARIAEKVRLLRGHGITRDAWRRNSEEGAWAYEVIEAGFKANLTDLQAAIGLVQMRRLDEFQIRREKIAHTYDAAFRELPQISVFNPRPGVRHARHLYTILLDIDAMRVDRAGVLDDLRRQGIGTSVHFVPIHLQPYYRERYGYRPGELPVAESASQRIMSLPIYPAMSDADVDRVVETLCESIVRLRR